MRIVSLSAAQGAQKEQQAINAAITFLKGFPELVPVVANPSSNRFLTKFLHILASNQNLMGGFNNHLHSINAAMESDASGAAVVSQGLNAGT